MMMGKKRWSFFKKLKKESPPSPASPTSSSSPKPKFFGNSTFKWRRLHIQLSFFDNVIFKVVSVLEAVVLVTTLAFFYLFCGCHF